MTKRHRIQKYTAGNGGKNVFFYYLTNHFELQASKMSLLYVCLSGFKHKLIRLRSSTFLEKQTSLLLAIQKKKQIGVNSFFYIRIQTFFNIKRNLTV